MSCLKLAEVVERKSVCEERKEPKEEEEEEVGQKRGGWCFSTVEEKTEANDNRKSSKFIQ